MTTIVPLSTIPPLFLMICLILSSLYENTILMPQCIWSHLMFTLSLHLVVGFAVMKKTILTHFISMFKHALLPWAASCTLWHWWTYGNVGFELIFSHVQGSSLLLVFSVKITPACASDSLVYWSFHKLSKTNECNSWMQFMNVIMVGCIFNDCKYKLPYVCS